MPVTDDEKAAKARDAALQGALTQIEREQREEREADDPESLHCVRLPFLWFVVMRRCLMGLP
jgi:hypothetical protein